MAKIRADLLLYNQGLVDSREKAKRLIMEGKVLCGTKRIDKPGEQIEDFETLTINSDQIQYVSRGGLKLEKAIKKFNLNLSDFICADIGSSTGGFTHCMLINGAKKVYSIDVGYNQLDYKLRIDDRVIVLERTNIRYLDNNLISDEIDFISIDVSFISLQLVLPKAYEILKDGSYLVALIKPQFEAGKEKVGKNGIIRDPKVHAEVLNNTLSFAEKIGFSIQDLTYSPIKGTKGNIEFLVLLKKSSEPSIDINIDSILKSTDELE
ncbi:23S rRNA (cytidine1920-2'-O)/16S rRNA (cytidine1409-2'-O)-methyltransferase [Peptoniphilus koenoeneniae]|uniref:23S rRNA (Cytidine1920-2'-O)/16S rRNA (Cytidine1409-2'-O)-methyltransferase n=1 Tax=Peptoniphilus koenoeneniae TaxID=507751 RepID=A0ABU0ATR8_9FIRM|nr:MULTISPECIES: TlyA family RNA methyltransferase [Peptoniphilus]ERT56770.1 ribosomal RNA large subunit methyltransferase J [Peptoniphilus sp. BV3C26]MDQ0274177.1 23S rRNA (cytidine1920-2'-O)/16S rRNA (cytidine1409-2'-O)-methyltransferase [Peptoniphilus koenoeneniae]